MKELPRRPIEPLPPSAGSFDAVLGRARYRRHRRAGTVLSVVAVFFAGIAGGMSLDGGVSGVRATIVGLATVDGGTGSAPATQTPDTSAAVTPEVDATTTPTTVEPTDSERTDAPADVVVALPQTAPVRVNGVAVDAAGSPIAGLYVYPGQSGSERFLAADEPVARTAKDGSFSVRCTGTPVLLAPWLVNAPSGGPEVPAGWAATFVGGGTEAASASAAPCTKDGNPVTTTVLRGSTVEGTVIIPEECSDARLPLWLWLYDDRSLTVRLPDLTAGSAYSVGGLPPGQHTLGANGNRSTVMVGGGATSTKDVRFGCGPGSPPETPDPSPTDSATPLPTPSGTPTSVPTGSQSPSQPDPEPSAVVSPSSSPTAQATPTGSPGTRR